MTILGKNTTGTMGFSSTHHIGVTSHIVITYDVHLEHLVKVASAIFLYFIIFPIIINKYWEACEIHLVCK